MYKIRKSVFLYKIHKAILVKSKNYLSTNELGIANWRPIMVPPLSYRNTQYRIEQKTKEWNMIM